MNVGSIVKILDNNEWHNLYGVVKYIYKGIAYIFCVQYPTYLYVAKPENQIIIIEE
ncbi:hypothetical protein [Clostridium pasteurianum]|uniref:Uncharacterized protein n=1 Tax=Clostridium pasteurianum BC1 TaxID=86416 RepID=R4K2R5_CLOPA|nr:hypothetical protein [Clostridium pasteurianum]AGK97402.1 hypothetical protein Clopa_2542 [Clostridium pasteurianum BC1]